MIEVGEYVRTKQGHIYKVKSVYKDMIWWCDLTWIDEKDIIKHSKKLIDLIEVGDYVNGYRVDKIVENLDDDRNSFVICNEYLGKMQKYKTYQIRGIVTKEQFANMEYRLEETND